MAVIRGRAGPDLAVNWPVVPSHGGFLGMAVCLLCLAASAACLVVVARQPAGLYGLLLAAAGALLAAAAAAVGVMTAGFFTLGYRLLPAGLGIRWFGATEILPYAAIDSIFAGHRLGAIRRVRGVSWPGLDVGLLRTRSLGLVHLFLRTREPQAISVIVLGGEAYALSPLNPQDFQVELIRRLEQADGQAAAGARAPVPSGLGTLADPWLAGLMAAALALLVLCFGVLASHFGDLPELVPLSFDGDPGDASMVPRADVLRAPLFGALVLGLNLALALALRTRERAAVYLLAAAAMAVESLLFVAIVRLLSP